MEFVGFGSGLLLLAGGGEALVRGIVARRIRLIGSGGFEFVRAFAVSAPVLAVAVVSAGNGSPTIALGSVVGANILALLLGVGAAGFIRPLPASSKTILWDGGSLLAAGVAFSLMSWSSQIGHLDGVLLLLGVLSVLVLWIRKRPAAAERARISGGKQTHPFLSSVLVAAGIASLVTGAVLAVPASVLIGAKFHFDVSMIGLTAFAAACSASLLFRVVIRAIRGENDADVPEILRFCLFNILAVVGVTSLLRAIPVSSEFGALQIPVLIVASAIVLPLMMPNRQVSRTQGASLILLYLAYVAVLCWRHGLIARFVQLR